MQAQTQDPHRELFGDGFPDGLGKVAWTLPGLVPDKQPILFAQSFALAQVGRARLVQPKKALNTAAQQQSQQGVGAKSTVGQHQIPGFKQVQESAQQAQLMLMFVAFGVVQQSAGGEAKNADQF